MPDELLFLSLAELYKKLVDTNARTEKTKLLSLFLKTLKLDEIEPAVMMITGNTFPESDKRVLNVGFKTIYNSMKSAGQKTS